MIAIAFTALFGTDKTTQYTHEQRQTLYRPTYLQNNHLDLKVKRFLLSRNNLWLNK